MSKGAGAPPAAFNEADHVTAPFLIWCCQRFQIALEEDESLAQSERAIAAAAFRIWIHRRLFEAAVQSSAVALNIAAITGALVAKDAQARLAEFGRLVANPVTRDQLLVQTPLLDRCLAEVAGRTLEGAVEVMRHFREDREALSRETFGVGLLTALEFGLGDSHCGGRTVCRFEIGGTLLIYKPRNLKTDEVFGRLIEWLGGRLGEGPRSLRVLNRGDRGWCEFAQNRECQDKSEVHLAYRRMGMLLAVFTTCGGTDLHFENLVFDGPWPFIVDLETILTPVIFFKRKDILAQTQATAFTPLRSGFLPAPYMVGELKRDISAAGLEADAPSPFRIKKVDRSNPERPQIRTEEYTVKPTTNVVRFAGEIEPPSAYVDELVEGFREASLEILSDKDRLLAPGGELSAFRDVEVRWVARGTAQYSTALAASHHPVHMRDGIDHEMAFSALYPAQLAYRAFGEVIRSEIDALWRRDIPLFRASATSRDVVDCSGRQIQGVFARSGFDDLYLNLANRSVADIERDARTIRASFAVTRTPVLPHPQPGRPEKTSGAPSLLDAAHEIGERILQDVQYVDGLPFWAAAEPLDGVTGTVTSTGYGLYSGMAGIGVFASEVYRQTADRRFLELTRACRKGGRVALDNGAYGLGAFGGASGILYAEICMAICLGETPAPALAADFDRLVRRAGSDGIYDIIGGVAGAGLVALRAAQFDGLEDALDLSARCGARLYEKAVVDPRGGVYWPSPQGGSPLAGFAHGAAGNAASLAMIGAALGDHRLQMTALAGLEFAHHGYDEESDLWLEAQDEAAKLDVAGSMAWCHGTPGKVIAGQMAREALKLMYSVSSGEARRGLRACADHLSGGNDSICHGILGNLEPLLKGDAEDRRIAAEVAHAVAQRGRQQEYRCSIGGGRNPGLMLGLAGMGLQLLRIGGHPTANVLRLELPGPE